MDNWKPTGSDGMVWFLKVQAILKHLHLLTYLLIVGGRPWICMLWCMCDNLRTICGGQFAPSTM